LNYVDLSKDVLKGGWTLDKDGLTLSKPVEESKIVLPVIPDGSYDYRAVVSISKSGEGPTLLLSSNASDGPFGILVDSARADHSTGFWQFKGWDDKQHRDRKLIVTWISKPAQKYTVDVAVRRLSEKRASVDLVIDGTKVVSWKGPETDLACDKYRQLPDKTLGLYGWTERITFHSIQVKMVSGELRLLRPGASR